MGNDEKYYFDIPEGGLNYDILDYCFNSSTQQFLLNAGLKDGMRVLEIGCGGGVMTSWIADQIKNGQVVAIDNSEEQLAAAKKIAEGNKQTNIEFKLCDAYSIEDLSMQFDLVYCRFVLHHVHKPRAVMRAMYNVLKPSGIAALEEGIVNHGFAYPYSIGFGNERFTILDNHANLEGKDRDGNFGLKLYTNLYNLGFKNLTTKIIAPSLITREEKALLVPGIVSSKRIFMEYGMTEVEWNKKCKALDELINDPSSIVGFYQSLQASGVK